MRDVGTLVWVVLIVIGVVSSMVSSVRKQAEAQRRTGVPAAPPRYPPAAPPRYPPRAAPAPQPPPPPPSPQPQPRAAVPPAPAPPDLRWPDHLGGEPRPRGPRLFAGKGRLVAAVIAAEVLGKPRAFSDEQFPR